jgi:hypothetical protein
MTDHVPDNELGTAADSPETIRLQALPGPLRSAELASERHRFAARTRHGS